MKRALLVLAVIAAAPATAAAEISHTIFLNRCVGGCTIHPSGRDNSITDESGTPQYNGMTTDAMVSEWRWDDVLWNDLVECVRNVYAPYDVTITDVDPAPAAHHEVVVAGYATEVGFTPSSSPGGIASRSSGCDPADNGLSYVFANQTSSLPYLCAAVAQESAHSFGLLDHLFDCTDPMTYLALGGQCGPKLFRNKLMPCGEDFVRSCSCGGARVNTHVQLLGVFGKGADATPPTASISYPAADASITENTIVTVAATDDRGIQRIDLLMNGWKWGEWVAPESITPPFSWPTVFTVDPTNGFPDGVIDLEVRVYNDLDGMATDTRRVTKGAACTSADSCLDGQTCDDEGRCLWAQPEGQIGDECAYDQFCVGPNTYDGVCGTVDDVSMCTETCFAGPNDACPDGYACRPDNGASGEGVCWFPPPPETCADCSGGGSGAQPMLFALGVGVIVLRRRRRYGTNV